MTQSDNLAQDYASAQQRREIEDARKFFEGTAPAPEGPTQFAAPPAPAKKAEPAMSRTASAGGAAAQGFAGAASAVPKAAAVGLKAVQRMGDAPEAVTALQEEISNIDAMLAGDLGDDERASLTTLRQKKTDALALNENAAAMQAQPVEDMALFKAGQSAEDAVAEAFPTDPAYAGEFTQDLARGAGTLGGFLVAAVVGGPAEAGLSGAALGAASQYEDAVASGADETTALQAAGIGTAIGSTDFLPIFTALKPFRQVTNRIVGAVAKMVQSAGLEATQEAVQTVAENLTAKGLYDPERGVLTGAGRAALIGGILGGGVTGSVAALGQRQDPRTVEQEAGFAAADQLSQDAEVAPTTEEALADALGDAGEGLTIEAASPEEATAKAAETRKATTAFDAATRATKSLLDQTRAEMAELTPAAQAEAVDVDVLVDNIIGVESGGVPDARNPNSSATGAGQFIESTWLRLIEKARPDLKGRSRAELLDLRNDPGLSREMVKAYAKENGDVLARAGLPVNNGTLYLAHFAGADGAVKALRAAPDTPVINVLGAAVVKANPFLKGKDARWLARWAAGKMGTPAGARRRVGVLRAREGRLVEAMARAAENPEDVRTRAAAAETLNAALERVRGEDVSSLLDFVGQRADEAGIDTLDQLLDDVRSGKSVTDGMRKRPLGDVIKSAGGVDPAGPAADELRAAGVTAQNSPGLFKKGGLTDLDTIVAEESELFAGRPDLLADDGTNVRPDVLVEALADEASGSPFRSLSEQEAIDSDPREEMARTLADLGIDLDQVSNEDVKRILAEIADEVARLRAMDEADAATLISEPAGEVAPGAAPEGEAGAQPAGKVYINHARINTPDDVKALIQQVADRDVEAIDKKRRGVVSHEQTMAEASKEYRNLEDLLGRKPGPMSAAQGHAAWNILTASGEQLMGLAKKARAPDATAEQKFAFRRAMQVHYAIQSEVLAATTETARALNALAIPRGSDKMRTQQIREMLDSGTDTDQIADMLTSLADNPAGMNTFILKSRAGRARDMLYTTWINGLLSGLKTHVVNITSNASVALYSIPQKYLEAGISKALYGGDVSMAEANAYAFGLTQGLGDAVRMAVLGRSSSEMGEQLGAFTKIENQYESPFSPSAVGVDPASALGHGFAYLGKAVELPGTLLGREDLFFKAIAYRMEINALAARTARAEGLEGAEFGARVQEIVADPPESLSMEALDAAHYKTFTQPLGKLGRDFQRLRSQSMTLKIIVPFLRTPVNIMKMTFQNTPLALVSSGIRADIAAGGPRASQALARIGSGTILMAAVAKLTAEGLITGAGPSDDDQARNLRQAGIMPYSIKVGEKRIVYSRLDPIGSLMGIAASTAEILADLNNEDGDELALAGVLAIADNLASKTYMSGTTEFIAAIDSRNPTSDLSKYFARQAGGLVPYSSLLRNVAQTGDPIYRDTKVQGGDSRYVDYFYTLRNSMASNIPGLSSKLPPRRDMWGEPMTRESGVGWGYDFISPMAARQESTDPVDRAMVENHVESSYPSRSIRGVKLTPEEYSDFSEKAGKLAKDMLDRIVAAPGFKRLPGGKQSLKSDLMKDAILRARKAARAQMMLEHPALLSRIREAEQERVERMMEQ